MLIDKELNLMRRIKRDELIRLAIDLIKMDSSNPPGKELETAYLIENKMKQFGLKVELDFVMKDRPNVYGLLKGKEKRPSLILNGHMDVVPPSNEWRRDPFKGEVINGKLYGLGSADMKGALSAMLIAVKALIDENIELRGNLKVMFVIDEEDKELGTYRLASRGERGNFAIVGEPTNLNIAIAHKGSVSYRIETIGRAAHSSKPYEGINAIYKIAEVINTIKYYNEELKSRINSYLFN